MIISILLASIGGQELIVLIGIPALILFALGYFVGLSKGRKEVMKK